MIQELLPLVKNTSINRLLEAQNISNGTYLLFDREGNLIEENVKESSQSNDSWESSYKAKSFNSKIINTNKAVVKKISSCSPYAFITWQDIFTHKNDFEKGGKQQKGLITLFNEFYSKLEEINSDMKDFDIIKNAMNKAILYVSEHVYDYFQKVDKKTGEITNGNMEQNRVLIFIEGSDEEYENCSKNYLKDKLFLDSNYNIIFDNITYGVPSNNNSYNSKKPFLKHLTQPNKISYQCNFDDCYAIYLLYIWLIGIRLQENTIKNNNGIIKLKTNSDILEVENDPNAISYYYINGSVKSSTLGTEFVINDFQVINKNSNSQVSNGTGNIFFINSENILELEKLEISQINSWKAFADYVNSDLFSYKLYSDDIKASDNISAKMVALYYMYAKIFRAAIVYEDISIISNCWDKYMTELILCMSKVAIKNADKPNYYNSIIAKLITMKYNFMASKYVNYPGGKKMKNNVIDTIDSVKEKVNGSDTPVSETVEEYSYAAGQLAKYLVKQSAAKDITFKEAAQVLDSKNVEGVTKAIRRLLKKYDHALSINYLKLNNMISMVTNVTFSETKVNKDMLLAGFVGNNILFEKKQSDENKEEN